MEGYTTAAINGAHQSNLAYRPEFISNDYRQGKKVLSAIENELRDCDAFMISAAFITQGGIQALPGVLKELEQQGIPVQKGTFSGFDIFSNKAAAQSILIFSIRH